MKWLDIWLVIQCRALRLASLIGEGRWLAGVSGKISASADASCMFMSEKQRKQGVQSSCLRPLSFKCPFKYSVHELERVSTCYAYYGSKRGYPNLNKVQVYPTPQLQVEPRAD